MSDAADQVQADILAVAEAQGRVFFLAITYYGNDSAKAAGYLFRRPVGDDGPAENILATNDTLRTLWCSPEGSVWSTSTTGLVWTTAGTPWSDTVVDPGLEFEAPEGGLHWRHVALPAQEHNGLPPNATAIWGTSDRDVFVGSFGGVMYHWNGERWSQSFSGIGESIGVIRGTAPDNVFAAGYGSTLLHFDGRNWKQLADPDGPGTSDTLTGITFVDDGHAYICGKSRGGRLLRGNANGFAVVGRYDVPFIGVARLQGRMVFAAAQSGAVELGPQGLAVLRDDIVPWSIAVGARHLYFTVTPGKPLYWELDLAAGTWRSYSH